MPAPDGPYTQIRMVTVIVPTYNEAGALPALVRRLRAAMDGAGIPFEVVVVDDSSPDGTGDLARELARDQPIRVLERPAKAGLASAVLDGLQMAAGELVAVMDADLSHPPEVLPQMVRALGAGAPELAVGSRYVPGGGIEDWPLRRTVVSEVANWMTRPLTPIRDATSGFFVIHRSALEGVALDPIGFKIGLETFVRARYSGYVEVPYTFTDRKYGASKFGAREIWLFLRQLGKLYREAFTRERPGAGLRSSRAAAERPPT